MKINRTQASAALLAAFALTLPFLPAADSPARPDEAPLVENLKDLKNLNRRIVRMASPSTAATVSLVAKGGGGAGSGVIVSEDGVILTAAHVIAALGDEFIVIFPDGTRKSAKALGADYDRDAAMGRITEDGSYPHVELGDSEALVRNDWCIALGHPGGYDPSRTPPVRLGRILSKDGILGRKGIQGKANFLITDSAVVGGDSGGPLFDADGRLIGIHSNIGATLMENRHVPVNVYKDNWEALMSGKRTGTRFAPREQRFNPNRPFLGVQLGEPGKDGGIVVERVIEDTPASKAGLQDGDVITKINDKEVASRDELIKVVGKCKPGREISVSYRRDGTDEKVKVKLARLGELAKQSAGNRTPAPGEESENAKKKEPKPGEKGDARQFSEEELKKRLAEAMKSGKLEMTPDQLRELGGVQKLHEYLRELAQDLDPEARIEFHTQSESADPFYAASARAITPVTKKAAASTVAVHLDGKQVALGTVVSEDNRILTKDTETRDGEVTVEIDGRAVPAKLLQRFPKRDLALFQVEAEGLHSVRWEQERRDIPVGSLLTSSSAEGIPLGFGLLSVKTRALAGIGFLGISGGESDRGVLISSVVNGSAAKKAGLKQGDIIIALDGESCSSPIEFGHRIRRFKADEEITLTILRGDEKLELAVTLGERQMSNDTARFRSMNEMSGPLSERTGGFPSAIQHDIPLQPSECGGPLLDLNGRCVGINVSRAGRVRTFAIPAGDLRALLAATEPKAGPAPEAAIEIPPDLSKEDCEAVLKTIEDLQRQIDELDQRVKQVRGE